MKSTKFHTVEKVPIFNRKIIERGKIDNRNTQIHGSSLPWLGTGTSIFNFMMHFTV